MPGTLCWTHPLQILFQIIPSINTAMTLGFPEWSKKLKLDIDKLRQSCVCECCPPSKDATFPPP